MHVKNPTFLFIISLLFSAQATLASDKVFLTNLPKNIDNSAKISAVKRAFLNRQWRIAEEKSTEVTATINHHGINAKVTIFLAGNNLMYQCNGTRESKYRRSGGGGTGINRVKTIKDFCPTNWVNNLKKDTSSRLLVY